MMELYNMVCHVYQLITTWVVVGCLTAPIVYGWYCVDKYNEERGKAWKKY